MTEVLVSFSFAETLWKGNDPQKIAREAVGRKGFVEPVGRRRKVVVGA